MSIKGSASISYDREKIAEFFGGMEKAWFPEGKDDPDISLICVMPEEGYYRDTKSGKMVSLLKVAAAAITGKPMDDGIEGKLKL